MRWHPDRVDERTERRRSVRKDSPRRNARDDGYDEDLIGCVFLIARDFYINSYRIGHRVHEFREGDTILVVNFQLPCLESRMDFELSFYDMKRDQMHHMDSLSKRSLDSFVRNSRRIA